MWSRLTSGISTVGGWDEEEEATEKPEDNPGNHKNDEGRTGQGSLQGQTCQGVSVTGTGIHKNNAFSLVWSIKQKLFTSILVPPGNLAQPFTIVQVRQEKPPGRKEPGGAESSQSYSQ